MKKLAILLIVLWSGSALAQSFPAGLGKLEISEKLRVKGCSGLKEASDLDLTINADGTWSAVGPIGTYTGSLIPADTKGFKWEMEFDNTSLNAYLAYLAQIATSVCGNAVTISQEQIQKFELKFKKDLSALKAQLKAQAAGQTTEGTGKGKHQLKGGGCFSTGFGDCTEVPPEPPVEDPDTALTNACTDNCNKALDKCGPDVFFAEYLSVQACIFECFDVADSFRDDVAPARGDACVLAQVDFIECCTKKAQCGGIPNCSKDFSAAERACGGGFGGCPLIFF